MQTLDHVAPGELVEARLQAHWAVQVVAAAGTALSEPAADHSHASLSWAPDLGCLLGGPLGSGQRLAYAPEQGRLLLLSDAGISLQDSALSGLTLQEVFALAGDWLGSPLTRPEHDLPGHPVGDGDPFTLTAAAEQAQLRRWLDFADSRIAAALSDLSKPVVRRVWPHHFDLAGLVTLDTPGKDGARSVGVGFSLGDDSYPEPYFYVTPWPYPDHTPGTRLPVGRWHTEGWTAAILTGTDILRSPAGQVSDFLTAAIGAAHAVLGADIPA